MVTIRLLGSPAIERDGVADPLAPGSQGVGPAGLPAAGRAASPAARHLAELLFDDAEDPLGAVRWTLAELRRTLGVTDALSGDPVDSAFGADVDIDVRRVEQSDTARCWDSTASCSTA